MDFKKHHKEKSENMFLPTKFRNNHGMSSMKVCWKKHFDDSYPTNLDIFP